MLKFHLSKTENQRSPAASQPAPGISAENGNSERQLSALVPLAKKDGGVDTHMFKVPTLSKAATQCGGYSSGDYSFKVRNISMDIQSKGFPISVEHLQFPKAAPNLRTDTESSTYPNSAMPRTSTMELSKSTMRFSNAVPITRTHTKQSTAYYSARSRVSIMNSLIKRQARTRALTDELSEEQKHVTWSL